MVQNAQFGMANGDACLHSLPFIKTSSTVPHYLPCVMMHNFSPPPSRHNYFSANTRISAETPRPSLPADLFTRPLPREVASYHILTSSKAESPRDFSALVCRCVCVPMSQDPGYVSVSVQKIQEPRRCSLHLLPLLLLCTVCLFSTSMHFCLAMRHGMGSEHSLGQFNPPFCLRVLQTKAAAAVPAL